MSVLELFLIVSFILLFSSLLQGLAGFGFALLSVPLLSFFLPLTSVVPLVVFASTVTNLFVVITSVKYLRLRQVWALILFGLLGIPGGVYILTNMNAELLKLCMGILILFTIIIMMSGFKVVFKKKYLAFGFAGLTSGILNGSISMCGPPIVLFLSNEGYEKNEFRVNLAFYGIIINLVTLISFSRQGFINTELIRLCGISMAALISGTLAGLLVARHINEKQFKNITYVILIVSSLITIVKSIISL